MTPRCLGTGAEGAVYLALESKTKRQLVCKLVNLGRQDGKMPQDELYRKLQEIDVLRQLKHASLANVMLIFVCDTNLLTA